MASSLSLLAMTRRYPPPRSETERGRGTIRSMVEGACGRSARSYGEGASVFAEAPPTALRAVPPPRSAGRDDRRMLQNLTV
jgi:hypothetical protein